LACFVFQVIYARAACLLSPVLASAHQDAQQVAHACFGMDLHRLGRLHRSSGDPKESPRPILRSLGILVCRALSVLITCHAADSVSKVLDHRAVPCRTDFPGIHACERRECRSPRGRQTLLVSMLTACLLPHSGMGIRVLQLRALRDRPSSRSWKPHPGHRGKMVPSMDPA